MTLALARRVGVVACVAAAVATTMLKLYDTLGVFDGRADQNAALTYAQRTHTHPEWLAAAGNLLEVARLWMPENARYRVVLGPRFDERKTGDLTHLLLYGFLLPRRPTSSTEAEWAFCYGCELRTLGDRYEVLARLDDGLTFGRVRA